MTIELVDGHGGKPHISGEDLGDFKAGILGDAGYVFKRANMLAATLNGSNSITIATGSGIMPTSGRHFRVTAPETLTITSGTQGQNRNDLIVVRATTDEESTTVETATLVVLRGTPTSGTATDPATQDGDLPLYRLQLTGVSVAEPIALFDVMVPYSEFRDSIYQVLELDEFTTPRIEGTTRYIAELPVDIPDGYVPIGVKSLSIGSQNSAVVLASFNYTIDTVLKIAMRNTSSTSMIATINVTISLLKVG